MAARRVLCFGPFVFDPSGGELRRDGEPVHLPPKAATVLQLLLERPLELVRKEELLDACWVDAHVGDAVLKVAIREIRRALGDDATRPVYVQTVHRRGYRLAQRVTVRATGTRASPVARPDRAAGVAALVGRDEEIAALARAYRDVEAGVPRVVLVEGEAGSGKSALVAAFLETLPRRVRVGLGVAAPEGGAPEPFGPVLGALAVLGRTHSSSGMDDRVIRALVDHAPTWVAHLPAVLAKVDAASVRERVTGAGTARMNRELCDALAALGRTGPVVVALEDLHLADAATLDLLTAAAHAMQIGRTLFIATYRPRVGVARSAIAQRRRALLGRPSVVALSVDPLAPEAVRSFLAARFPAAELDDDLVARVHADTSGNPLFLRAFADAWETRAVACERAGRTFDLRAESLGGGAPEAVRAMIEAELDELGPEARELAELVAVHGRPLHLAAAAVALGRPEAALDPLATGLAEAGRFLRRQGVDETRDGRVVDLYAPARPLFAATAAVRVGPAQQLRWRRALASS